MSVRFRKFCKTMRSVSDKDSWGREKKRAAAKEREIKKLIWTLSQGVLSLRPIGVGVEGKYVSKSEKTISRAILDYVIWNVKKRKLVALSDIVSTRWGGEKGLGKFFPVALWKKDVMIANTILTTFIYELELEKAVMKDRIWWYIGTDIAGEIEKNMETWHRGQVILQDVVKSSVKLWVRGLDKIVIELLKV